MEEEKEETKEEEKTGKSWKPNDAFKRVYKE